jgi:Pentapeptide repeats (8 copies)
LSLANLYSADLRSANLSSADLRSAKYKENAYLPIFCKWGHSIKGNKIQIGCKEKTIKQWDIFFENKEVYSTERNTEDFKQIQAVYEAYKAYLTFLNK